MDVTRRAVLSLAPALALAAGKKKSEKRRPGRVGLLELSVHRISDEKRIEVDGRLRNDGDKPLQGLALVLHFLGADEDQVTQLRGRIDNEVLDAGDEAEFHWQLGDHPRAVEVRVTGADSQGFEVDVDRPGPYPVE
ncbi:MAG TPA: hypothetical protein VHA11_11910 [Bryobacteraceae bacterium]|nr:hypothetical protein [Bryobacteraceae bacterium]